jgi:hypothetical protein
MSIEFINKICNTKNEQIRTTKDNINIYYNAKIQNEEYIFDLNVRTEKEKRIRQSINALIERRCV